MVEGAPESRCYLSWVLKGATPGQGMRDWGWGMEVRRLTPYSEDKHGLAGQRLKGERARDGPQTVDGAKS